jgi:hypothetical protein
MTIRGWGARLVMGVTLGRPEANDECHGELQGRRGRRGTADGGEARRWSSGEANPVMQSTRAQTNDMVFLLTSLRSSRG